MCANVSNTRCKRSAGKSVTSTLVGIAIGAGLLPGVDAPALSFLEEYRPFQNPDERKERIRIHDMLTMHHGLDAYDWDRSSQGREIRMMQADDWIRFAVDLPMVHEPGTEFRYSAASAHLLGGIVSEVAGMGLDEFLEAYLLGPLGIDEYRWRRSPQGRPAGAGNLSLRARDSLKFGQLFLNGGVWNGLQVVPEDWVTKSGRTYWELPPQAARWIGSGYGYLWWIGYEVVDGEEIPFRSAAGNGGQMIYVVPTQDLVVVAITAAYDTDYGNTRTRDIFNRVLRSTL